MLGAIVGDYLGSVHEFNAPKRKDFVLLDPRCAVTAAVVAPVNLTIPLPRLPRRARDLHLALLALRGDFPDLMGRAPERSGSSI